MSFLGSLFNGAKNVASYANPVAGAAYDAASGNGPAAIGKNFLSRGTTDAKIAAPLALGALTGGGSLAAGGAAAGGAGGGGGLLASLFGGGGLSNLATLGQLGLGGLGAYQSAKDTAKGNKLQQQVLNMANQQWASGQPMRDRASQIAMQPTPTAPDLSSIYRSGSNPFARSGHIPSPGGL